jgi:hypothetical protein
MGAITILMAINAARNKAAGKVGSSLTYAWSLHVKKMLRSGWILPDLIWIYVELKLFSM